MPCSMVAELEGVTDNAAEVVAEAPDPRLLYKAPPTMLQLETYAKSCGLVDLPMMGRLQTSTSSAWRGPSPASASAAAESFDSEARCGHTRCSASAEAWVGLGPRGGVVYTLCA